MGRVGFPWIAAVAAIAVASCAGLKMPSMGSASAEPRAKLIDDLLRTRTKLFASVSADGLAEIRRVNAILNALRYRDT
jgi:hypothetical protein